MDKGCDKCGIKLIVPSWKYCYDCTPRKVKRVDKIDTSGFGKDILFADGLKQCPVCKDELPPWDFPRLTDIQPTKPLTCRDCLSVKYKNKK